MNAGTADAALALMRERWDKSRRPLDPKDVEERAAIRMEEYPAHLRIRATPVDGFPNVRLWVEVYRADGQPSRWWSCYISTLAEVDQRVDRARLAIVREGGL